MLDTSVLTRIGEDAVFRVVNDALRLGPCGLVTMARLELGVGAISQAAYEQEVAPLLGLFQHLSSDPVTDLEAEVLQERLRRRGYHRGVSPVDLMVAAAAIVHHMPVLHYDKDFDLIAEVSDLDARWVVPRGTID